jgi:hypothetical protein
VKGTERESMGTRKTGFNKTGIGSLPNNKPVLYRIETETGKLNYAGVAQRGRVQDRLSEHLGEIPGATVRIEQFSSIEDAREKEARVIKRNQPKYNDQGK